MWRFRCSYRLKDHSQLGNLQGCLLLEPLLDDETLVVEQIELLRLTFALLVLRIAPVEEVEE